MSVYLMVDVTVNRPEMYEQYIQRVPEIIRRFGGRYLVRGGKITPVSGGWNPERAILVEFPSMEQCRACFQSPEYLELSPFREQSTTTRAILMEGCNPHDA